MRGFYLPFVWVIVSLIPIGIKLVFIKNEISVRSFHGFELLKALVNN